MNLVYSAAKIGAALIFGAALVVPGSGLVGDAKEAQSGGAGLTTSIRLAGGATQQQSATLTFQGAILAGNAKQIQSGAGQLISQAPIWSTIPEIVFIQGVSQVIHLEGYASSSLSLKFTEFGSLPSGVTFSNSGNTALLTYDGIGGISHADDVQLVADDSASSPAAAAVSVSTQFRAETLTTQITLAGSASQIQIGSGSLGSIVVARQLSGTSGVANVAAGPQIIATALTATYSQFGVGTLLTATGLHAVTSQAGISISSVISASSLHALTTQAAILPIGAVISGSSLAAHIGIASLTAPLIAATGYHATDGTADIQNQPGILATALSGTNSSWLFTAGPQIEAIGGHATTSLMQVQAGIFRPGNSRVFRIGKDGRNSFVF